MMSRKSMSLLLLRTKDSNNAIIVQRGYNWQICKNMKMNDFIEAGSGGVVFSFSHGQLICTEEVSWHE